jgi:hypothetical protein
VHWQKLENVLITLYQKGNETIRIYYTFGTMQKLFNILFLSCLKASELVEKNIHFKLSFTEKMQLKLHKSMCEACRIYEKQSSFIEKGISMQKPGQVDPANVEQLKVKIRKMLETKDA